MAAYDRKDHLYRKAKDEGMRSRAAYKLVELNDKHRLIRNGSAVLDLGAWPGGWLQIALELVGDAGKVVGIDLVEIEDLGDSRLKLIRGDARDAESIEQATAFAGRQFDVLLSDMSPKLSGIREVDMAACLGLLELCVDVAGRVLKPGGSLVCKTFKGGGVDSFVKNIRPLFNKVIRCELDATRKTSNEFYLIGLGLRDGQS